LDGRTQPPANEILICQNGLLHVPTRSLHPHDPAYFAHAALDYDYDLDAPKPKAWLKWQDGIWADDSEAKSFMQEITGYFVSGSTNYQKIPLIVGPRRSGKGTFARVVEKLLGPSNVCSPTMSSFSGDFPLQPLIGKTLAILSDARLGGKADQKAITETLLRVSGEDAVNVSRKNTTDWYGHLPTRFLIMTNELPRLLDASGALASRFIVLMMRKSFLGKEDHSLTARLLNELPGILNWALDGWERLDGRGYFKVPQSSNEAIDQLADLTSPVAAFARDRCLIKENETEEIDKLYNQWKWWCGEEGRGFSGTKASFKRDLSAAYPEISECRPRSDDGPRPRKYQGISLITGFESEQSSDDQDGDKIF
jgi:putative DNA primase/helicase